MRIRRIALPLLICGSIATVWSGLGYFHAHYIYNETPSEPLGFYQTVPLHGVPKDGQIVTFCVDPRWAVIQQGIMHGWIPAGHCPEGLAPFLKTVVATPGQTVHFTAEGVSINGGQILPHSAPKAYSYTGKVRIAHFPFHTYTLPKGRFWAYGAASQWSVDSRYYGPVATKRIIAVEKPVWTFR